MTGAALGHLGHLYLREEQDTRRAYQLLDSAREHVQKGHLLHGWFDIVTAAIAAKEGNQSYCEAAIADAMEMAHLMPTILVHRLKAHEVDNNIGYYLMCELAPHGLITSEKDFGSALIAVVISISPHNPVEAWNLFSLNTLRRLREKLNNLSSTDEEDFITPFAHIYHRLLQLKIGASLLDVGCACAFWPVLAAEYAQTISERIVGVDSRRDAIALSNNLAAAINTTNIEFIQTDLLAQEFLQVGIFDTVTAIALLEHIPEEQLPQAFDHLLSVTRQRLIISVPYEERATLAYGHHQVFTREKLEHWGKWCVERLQNQGRFWCEDVMGGLLVVELR